MKTLFISLIEHVMKMINFKKKKLLTKQQEKSYGNAKTCYIVKKNLKISIWKIKDIVIFVAYEI